MLRYLGTALIDLLYPPPRECPLCCRPGLSQSGGAVCTRCEKQIAGLKAHSVICSCCGRYFSNLEDTSVPLDSCVGCRENRPGYELARAVGPYEGILREAVYQLKYQGRLTLAEPLGKLMANTIRKELNQVVVGVGKERSSVLKPLVVPVPLHPNRLGDRGFNQAKVLAEVVARELSLELDAGFLVRTADTPSQTGFSREERRINLADAFTAGKSVAAILGCPIVLVDDVLTTGSTCEACARLLLDWGSGPVVVVTIATGKLKVSKN